ncbi:MAG: CehA/McbA family metallohydrolase [Pseudonocardiales bacterium]|nr:CehA/McbA family metallohydrolase [Pseudonocardiales bacterium]MBV9029975.1 CehA/McbA family metallohydrolase [Pseudonocardiales bacterium]MBW0011292.1 CehA/McbA family metallohydrolase [Pseudonocardiales bacterium]
MNTGEGMVDAQALLLSATAGALLRTPGPESGAARSSRISRGTMLVHADMHNHTLLSDGVGAPEAAFPSMRDAGLDVAALTDHAVRGAAVEGTGMGGTPWIGLDRAGWRRTGEFAEAYDRPGEFTAIRGFEWSHPWWGHVNAWFTDEFTDVATHGAMDELYAWLTTVGRRNGVPTAGLAGFNHPGREDGRFAGFRYAAAAAEQMVSLEMFNRTDDYLFQGVAAGATAPLVACLNAGWRPGLLGVSDEHSANWGLQPGTGRAGLWVAEHSRAGVAEALRARRFFATRVAGLRVDATAGGVRMGSVLRHRQGPVEFVLDVAGGASWIGRALQVQVLRPDTPVPSVADVVEMRCGDLARFTVPMSIEDGHWTVLRLADPDTRDATQGPPNHPANNYAVAYTSPWFLQP